MAWYREWFGEEYLELYAHRNAREAADHVGLLEIALGDEKPAAVLDLACGAGRHTAALREKGYRALGVDLSLTLLAQRPDLPRVAGDMRRLPFGDGTFDWVLNFFTSFGYFESERENFRVLEEVVRLLAPGGLFLIDLMNRERTLAQLEARGTSEVGGRRVEVERWFDESTQRINKRIRVQDPDGAARNYLESVRAYSRDEVTIGLRWAGLEVTHHFGNFRGDPHQSDSERLILLARKPG